jgi:cardiolipin synthase A/B
MTWLLVTFFIPIPGVFIYLLVGENRLPNRRIERHGRLLKELDKITKRQNGSQTAQPPKIDRELQPVIHLAEQLGYMPVTGGNDGQLIAETDEMIDRLIADIDAATREVHLLYYIFVNDQTGKRVVDALIEAVRRGVTCRLLVDAVGSRPMLKDLAPILGAAGVEVHAALPVHLLRRKMARLDLRNHRKIAVIDGRIGYTGSQNIVNADYGHRDLAWHDLSVRLEGPIVTQLQTVFIADWYFETDDILDSDRLCNPPEPAGDISIQSLPSGPNFPSENYQRLVVAAIYNAREKVTITSPYFIPDEAFLQAVEVAILGGVEVELILPRKCDQYLVGAASRSYYIDLLDMGVKLYMYEPGLLHAKTMTIDNSFGLIGSSNFDIRSFALNFEISILCYGDKPIEQLRKQQALYREESTLLSKTEWASRSCLKQHWENIAKLLSPLL